MIKNKILGLVLFKFVFNFSSHLNSASVAQAVAKSTSDSAAEIFAPVVDVIIEQASTENLKRLGYVVAIAAPTVIYKKIKGSKATEVKINDSKVNQAKTDLIAQSNFTINGVSVNLASNNSHNVGCGGGGPPKDPRDYLHSIATDKLRSENNNINSNDNEKDNSVNKANITESNSKNVIEKDNKKVDLNKIKFESSKLSELRERFKNFDAKKWEGLLVVALGKKINQYSDAIKEILFNNFRLYNCDGYVAFLKKIPGYDQYIINLFKKLQTNSVFRDSAIKAGLDTVKIAGIHKGIQAAKALQTKVNPQQVVNNLKDSLNALKQNQAINLSHSIENLLKKYTQGPDSFKWVAKNPAQQEIQKKLLQTLDEVVKCNKQNKAPQFVETIIKCASCANELNKKGDFAKAQKLSIVCDNLLAFMSGTKNAVVDNAKNLKNLVMHPIETAQNIEKAAEQIGTKLINFILNPKPDEVYAKEFEYICKKIAHEYANSSSEKIAEEVGYAITDFALLTSKIPGPKTAVELLGKTELGKKTAKVIGKAAQKGAKNFVGATETILSENGLKAAVNNVAKTEPIIKAVNALKNNPEVIQKAASFPVEQVSKISSDIVQKTNLAEKVSKVTNLTEKEIFERIEKILKSDGRFIGIKGSSEAIRIIEGSEQDAKKLFDQLVEACNAKHLIEIHPKQPNSLIVHLDKDRTIAYRHISTSGPPTIDVKLPEWEDKLKKIKYATQKGQ